jgi:hypothetical protein
LTKISTRKKKITRRDKVLIAETYERRLEEGEPRKSILKDLSEQYDRDTRTIERYISEGRAIRVENLKSLLDLPWFADRLLKSLRVREPLQINDVQCLETGELWLEKQPGFHTFKRHFRHKEFWDNLENWKRKAEAYRHKCFELLDKISCQAERESQMTIPKEHDYEEGIYDTFPARAYQHILLKTKPQLDSLSGGYLRNLEETHFDIDDNELIVRGQGTLAKGKPYRLRRLIEVYQKLTSNPLLLETTKEIWHLYHELRDTTNYLCEELNSFRSRIAPNWIRFSPGLLE